MPKTEPETIEDTLVTLVRPGITPKQLLKAAREAHPKASRKEIVRAAFASMIRIADQNPSGARALQDFGLNERIGE